MGKRKSKEEEGFRLIAAMVVLAVGVWMFVPAFRPWIVGIGILVTIGLVAAVAKKCRTFDIRPTQLPPPYIATGPVAAQARSSVPSALPPQPPAVTSVAQRNPESVLAALRRIDWFHFEKVIEALYLSHGYTVRRLGGAHPDGGVDLIVTTPDDRFVVQCKHWCRDIIGVQNIRELLGTLTDSGIPKGVYATMRGYSDPARDVGVRNGLVLLDEKQLVELIIALGPDYGARVMELLNDPRKFCPKCEAEMVLRTARHGKNPGKQFWGCSDYPRCKGTLEAEGV